ncbi:MAG: glycosyltransferase family 9 protein [Alphaproteobacteria bacterium]
MAAGEAVTHTPLLKFAARAPFRFRQHNTGEKALQTGRGGESFFTNSDQFANRVVLATPKQFRVLEPRAALACLPREEWSRFDFRGKRALFLLPSQALGSNVATLLFVQALREAYDMPALGVFCARSAADIYLTDPQTTVYPLWIGERDLRRWDVLVDLGHLESRRDVDVWPVDMEADLLEAFGVTPSRRYAAEGRPLPHGRPPLIGVLPLASSPLRTLPVEATRALCHALAPHGPVTLCLNQDQHQGVLYARSIGALPPGVRVLDGFASIGDLLSAIAGFDYAVFADSGPAHMSKLFATPGVAVYTSAPGDVLQGRFRNLANWTVPFSGPVCAAPCGLAKLRATPAGRIGCMGSLGVTLEGLPSVARGANQQVVERLLLEQPVPCVAALRDAPHDLVSFVLADLERRVA